MSTRGVMSTSTSAEKTLAPLSRSDFAFSEQRSDATERSADRYRLCARAAGEFGGDYLCVGGII